MRTAARGRLLFLLAAAVLVAFVVDIPRLIIEIFNLPVPRLGGNPPYLILPVLTLIWAYLYLRGVRRIHEAIEPGDLLFIGALLLCALVEVYHWASGQPPDFRLVTEALWWFTAYYAVKQHVLVSRAPHQFVRVALAIVVAIGVVHLLALTLAELGGITNAEMLGEILGRNGISLLLVGALYLYWFGLPAGIVRPWHTILLLAIVFIQAIANHARAAIVALIVLLIARFAWGAGPLRKPILIVLALSVVMGAALVSFGYPSLLRGGWLPAAESLPQGASVSDETRSVVYRLAANKYLVDRFVESPLIGVGASSAAREQVGGRPSHTYYLIVLAAYGLVGWSALAVAMSAILVACIEVGRRRAAVFALLLVTILSFVNDLYAWLAMLAAVATTAEQADTTIWRMARVARTEGSQ